MLVHGPDDFADSQPTRRIGSNSPAAKNVSDDKRALAGDERASQRGPRPAEGLS
jgi:hypothetical protein